MDKKYKITISLYGTIYFSNENGILSRDNGPAVQSVNRYVNKCGDATYKWINNGRYHRITGPAVKYPAGEICWYKNGKRFLCKTNFFNSLTDEEKFIALSSPDFINSQDLIDE